MAEEGEGSGMEISDSNNESHEQAFLEEFYDDLALGFKYRIEQDIEKKRQKRRGPPIFANKLGNPFKGKVNLASDEYYEWVRESSGGYITGYEMNLSATLWNDFVAHFKGLYNDDNSSVSFLVKDVYKNDDAYENYIVVTYVTK